MLKKPSNQLALQQVTGVVNKQQTRSCGCSLLSFSGNLSQWENCKKIMYIFIQPYLFNDHLEFEKSTPINSEFHREHNFGSPRGKGQGFNFRDFGNLEISRSRNFTSHFLPLGQLKSNSLHYSESISVLIFEFRLLVEEIWAKEYTHVFLQNFPCDKLPEKDSNLPHA